MNSKLERQLAELLMAEVISSETAEKISAYYDTKAGNKSSRLFMVFGVIGALLSGLGIVLIIAHNWDDMPRNIKSFIAFLPLLIGQIACGYSFIKKKGVTWIESSVTFLILASGASISLISQIYNIPGSLSDFLLVWMLISAPLIYLLRSNLAVIIHLVLATWYVCDTGYFSNPHVPWWFLAAISWVLPYYVSLQKTQGESNIAGVMNWLLPTSLVIVLGAFMESDTLAFITYLALFGLLYNTGQLSFLKSQKLRRNGPAVIGSVGTIILLIVLTFKWFWIEALQETNTSFEIAITILLFGLATTVLAYLQVKRQLKEFNLFQYAFLIIGLVYLTKSLGHVHTLIITNLLVAALGLFAVRIGIRKASYGILNYGLLILTALITCRFFDTDLDFVFRGILFISVGAGFFFANYLLIKKQRKSTINSSSNTQKNE